jgi:hypothetical protein
MRLAIIYTIIAALAGAQFWPSPGPGRAPYGGGGGGLAAFSDDFNRADADALGANWTEISGDIDISGNAASATTGAYAYVFATYNSPVTTVNQYAYVIFPGGVVEYPQILFRYTNSSSPFYHVEINCYNSITSFYSRSALAGTSTLISEVGTAGSACGGASYGITLTGTGASTVVRIWRNPTGSTPTSATDWGGDTTPDYTHNTNPGANAVDTGLTIGIGGQQNDPNTVKYDAWGGGDIP